MQNSFSHKSLKYNKSLWIMRGSYTYIVKRVNFRDWCRSFSLFTTSVM